MNMQLKELFHKIQSNGGHLIVPNGNLTYELQSKWVSKLDGKFKVECRIAEIDKEFHEVEENSFISNILLKII